MEECSQWKCRDNQISWLKNDGHWVMSLCMLLFPGVRWGFRIKRFRQSRFHCISFRTWLWLAVHTHKQSMWLWRTNDVCRPQYAGVNGDTDFINTHLSIATFAVMHIYKSWSREKNKLISTIQISRISANHPDWQLTHSHFNQS